MQNNWLKAIYSFAEANVKAMSKSLKLSAADNLRLTSQNRANAQQNSKDTT